MKKDIQVYLDDIQEAIKKIEAYTKGKNFTDFVEDTELEDAVIRRLEIIGEAVKNLPSDIKERHSSVPWKQIDGMRDILIHEYAGVSIERVWKVIEDDIVRLKEEIRKM